jgi:hypothetical protein
MSCLVFDAVLHALQLQAGKVAAISWYQCTISSCCVWQVPVRGAYGGE